MIKRFLGAFIVFAIFGIVLSFTTATNNKACAASWGPGCSDHDLTGLNCPNGNPWPYSSVPGYCATSINLTVNIEVTGDASPTSTVDIEPEFSQLSCSYVQCLKRNDIQKIPISQTSVFFDTLGCSDGSCTDTLTISASPSDPNCQAVNAPVLTNLSGTNGSSVTATVHIQCAVASLPTDTPTPTPPPGATDTPIPTDTPTPTITPTPPPGATSTPVPTLPPGVTPSATPVCTVPDSPVVTVTCTGCNAGLPTTAPIDTPTPTGAGVVSPNTPTPTLSSSTTPTSAPTATSAPTPTTAVIATPTCVPGGNPNLSSSCAPTAVPTSSTYCGPGYYYYNGGCLPYYSGPPYQ